MFRHKFGPLTNLAIAGCTVALVLSGVSVAGASGSTSGGKIAFSNSYDGNAWRHSSVAAFTASAKQAKKEGLITSFSVVNGNNNATQQIAQLQAMILQGYKSIVIDAASPTALNGVIAQACAAGIKVVVYDSLATAPCAYKIESNYVDYGTFETSFVAKQLGGKGNVLEIRGVAGTSVDVDINKGIAQTIAANPGLKNVGSVYGNWTETVAETAVAGILPSLPTVNAVVDEGGDGAGAVSAFQAQHIKVPLVIMGNRGDELRAWKALVAADPSYNDISISSVPGMSSAAFWVAEQLATGHKEPKVVWVPLLEIPYSHLNAWIAATPATGVASKTYSLSDTQSFIKATKANKPVYINTVLP
jgi:ribose transport system substrate-binding protein